MSTVEDFFGTQWPPKAPRLTTIRSPDNVLRGERMAKVYDLVREVADTATSVVILGETGVGKEVVAQKIHSESDRREAPFVALNCAALPESLLETKGAGAACSTSRNHDTSQGPVGYVRCVGTWGSGPFGNDAALDYVADVVKPLEDTVKGFVDDPEIDGDFDFALAAIALLNAIYGTCNAYRPEPTVARAWQAAFLACFDEQIDSLKPKGSYKPEKRETIVRELGRFVAACEDFHGHA